MFKIIHFSYERVQSRILCRLAGHEDNPLLPVLEGVTIPVCSHLQNSMFQRGVLFSFLFFFLAVSVFCSS